VSRTVLITGGAGFVGANLARRALRDGHDVHLIVRGEGTPWRLADIAADVRLHRADLSDRDRLDAVAAAVRPEWIFHLAARGAYSWDTDLDAMVKTNVIGTMNLVQSCLRVGFAALVNTGSSSEYGYKDHAPAEDEWIDPASDYAVTKAAATHYCRHVARREGVAIPTLRLYSVYGPWEEPGRLVPSLLTRALASEWPPMAHPDIARDFVFTEDVIDAYMLAAAGTHADPGAVYNVGTGVQTTLRDIVETVRRIVPVPVEPRWGSMADRAWDTITWVADKGKIQETLGWTPRVDVEAGLRATLAWMRDHPEIVQRYRDAVGS
jgi:nucleoside-diphosphate-sugar epimerase